MFIEFSQGFFGYKFIEDVFDDKERWSSDIEPEQRYPSNQHHSERQ